MTLKRVTTPSLRITDLTIYCQTKNWLSKIKLQNEEPEASSQAPEGADYEDYDGKLPDSRTETEDPGQDPAPDSGSEEVPQEQVNDDQIQESGS